MVCTEKKHKGTLWSGGNILYLDLHGGYKSICICKNLLTAQLRLLYFMHFIRYVIH